jgi:hypothetical protein
LETYIRNYDHDPKPFKQNIVDGQVVRYPIEGENPTPFYENLRATLPGVSSVSLLMVMDTLLIRYFRT